MQTRKYQVHNRDLRKVKVVSVKGNFEGDRAWAAEAARVAGWPDIDPSYDAENVIRLFPWWLE